MGKTETIKKRRVDIYLITEKQKERWKEYAKSKNMPLSRFIRETCNDRISGNLQKRIEKRMKLIREREELEEEYNRLKIKNLKLQNHIDMLEKQKRRTQILAHLLPGDGYRMFDKELTMTLRFSKKPMPTRELIINIRLDPTDEEMVEGILKQLESLQGIGLVKQTAKGWIWKT
jgi:hypothetical protein